MRWSSNSVKPLRDTERETLPPTPGSPIAKAIERFANENQQKFLLL